MNLQCAEADGVSEEIRNFVVPLCANIHMAGSMITITACATAVCLMNQLPISLATVVPFIMTLGIAMVASPGAPGGSIMTALPFLYMVFGPEAGDVNGPICAIMVALYITQDSFGTACNVSGGQRHRRHCGDHLPEVHQQGPQGGLTREVASHALYQRL